MKLKTVFLQLSFMLLMLCLHAQQANDKITAINNALKLGQKTISDVLTDTNLMYLHSLTDFREVIKQNAKAEKIKLNTSKEPGVNITVKGIINDKSGAPLSDQLVYVYHTSSEGWYADTAPHILQNEGDRKHARLFGYFKTNNKGEFEFVTIRPRGYPNSSLPAHIHIEITGNNSLVTELLFDDDPRLIGEIRKHSMDEHFIISQNSGTPAKPVYYYKLSTPL